MVMPSAIDSMISVIPTMVVGKVVMDFSERAFGNEPEWHGKTRKTSRVYHNSVRHTARKKLGIAGGNFSNIGF